MEHLYMIGGATLYMAAATGLAVSISEEVNEHKGLAFGMVVVLFPMFLTLMSFWKLGNFLVKR